MRFSRALKELIRNEDGGFMGTAIVLAVIIAIMAIAIIDGTSVYSTYKSVTDATEEAAARARNEYRLYQNEALAEKAAIEYCEEKGLVFIGIEKVQELGSNAFMVTCEKDADTFAFKILPYLKELIHQRSSGTSYRSI